MRSVLSTRVAAWTSALLLGLIATAHADDAANWPKHPIRMMVGFSAGGSTDIVARIIGPGLTKILGEPVIVENRPGAGGTTAAALLSIAPADGYTMMACTNGMLTTYQYIQRKPAFDAEKQILPVIQIASIPYILLVPSKANINSVQALMSEAKAKSSGLNYGSSGVGSGGHLAGALFADKFSVHSTHVPYKGSSQAMIDLVANNIDFAFDQEATVDPFLTAGTIKALAVANPTRLPNLPNVPTMDELGYPMEASAWAGVCLPGGTNIAIADKLNKAVAEVMKDPEVQKKFAQLGLVPVYGTRQQFDDLISSDRKKWGPLIKQLNIQTD